jgi:hypothetical protein
MMKLTAAAAIGALILAASAGPAFAGYWDGAIVPTGPSNVPPPAADPCGGGGCPCNCAPAPLDRYGGEGWEDSAGRRGGDWRADQNWSEDDNGPGSAYQDEAYGEAPAEYLGGDYGVGPAYVVEESGGGGGGFGFARADAFANASAFAVVDVDIHDGHHHHMPPYPPHMGGWGQMPGYHQMQPHYGMQSYGHPMMMHSGGGYRHR